MPIARSNPQFNVIKEFGSDGELAFIEIDYGSDVSAETGDFDAGDSAVCALGMVQRAVEQTCNILGKGPLTDSDTRQTFIVRADTLSRDTDGTGGLEYNDIESTIQTAVRADFDIGLKFAKWLGLKNEGLMEYYGIDGSHHYRYARIF